MNIIEVGFLIVFAIGVLLIVGPFLEKLSVWVSVFRRNRFYEKRKLKGRVNTKSKIGLQSHPIYLKIEEKLSVAEIKISLSTLLLFCGLIAVIIFLVCYRVMPAPFYNALVGAIIGTTPLLWAWSRYQKKNLAMSSVMIPTIQNFIGYFSESENLHSSIYEASRTVPLEIMSEWNKLIMDLQTGEPPDESLIQFADRVGNDWAHYFADILITHLETGVDITSSLFKLISEMQNAVYNEENRIKLLHIYKWGTILMVGLSVFVVYFNIKMDPNNRYYYFIDPSGIRIVSLCVLILFLSFVGAMQMGRKKL
ncbi:MULTISPECIES: type II secretion system F family protein [unclassified Paenibacillus]|uniref:type II secretion system F family protein n=1 Tax=unclassified Paenibacillus TaxID=185978 RepID=UPI00301B2091